MRIIASSSLNEYRIRELLDAGAPIDGFGVGTEWAVSPDAPELDFAYKLAEYDGKPRMKASSNKATWPGAKQVWRQWNRGRMERDRVTAITEPGPAGAEALLRPVIESGELLPGALNNLTETREHARTQMEALPSSLRGLESPESPYPVQISEQLETKKTRLQAEFLDER